MIFILLLLFDESIDTSTTVPLWLVLLGGSLTTIAGIIGTYLATRKKEEAVISLTDAQTEKTEAEVNKTKIDTISLTIDKLVELTTKFKLAQDEYILLKDKFAILSREFDDFKVMVQELLFLMDAILITEPANSPLRKHVDRIKTEFLTHIKQE